ncbi:putative MutL 1 [Teratosphaeria destructans]|uniref:MutL 1 n=1 Tax=Teratosphaeria destructans TaxID=418781 RepID=A0A9W7T2G5_9PEZI|nr:putative MutL 1 [Teratosphaeria destructans]
MLLNHWIKSLGIVTQVRLTYAAIVNTDFHSAINVNVCQEIDGGSGFGRVTFDTNSCDCTGPRTLRAKCRRTRPNPREGHIQDYDRECDDRDPAVLCFPAEDADRNDDCSCTKIDKKYGSKPPHTTTGIACSQPLSAKWASNIKAIDVYSTVVTSKPQRSEIHGCYTETTRGRRLNNHYPCGSAADNGDILAFANGDDYHACIETNDDTPDRINFEWVIQSPWGHLKRDDGSQYDLRDLFHVDRTTGSDKYHGSIVLLNEHGEELDRYDP